jgi:hypothetical protein
LWCTGTTIRDLFLRACGQAHQISSSRNQLGAATAVISKPHRFTNFCYSLASHRYSTRNSNYGRDDFLNKLLRRQVRVAESKQACYRRGPSFSSSPLARVRIANLPVPARNLRERRSGKTSQAVGLGKEEKVENETKKKTACAWMRM